MLRDCFPDSCKVRSLALTPVSSYSCVCTQLTFPAPLASSSLFSLASAPPVCLVGIRPLCSVSPPRTKPEHRQTCALEAHPWTLWGLLLSSRRTLPLRAAHFPVLVASSPSSSQGHLMPSGSCQSALPGHIPKQCRLACRILVWKHSRASMVLNQAKLSVWKSTCSARALRLRLQIAHFAPPGQMIN